MAGLLTVEEILERRRTEIQRRIDEAQKKLLLAALSDSKNQTATLNLPPPPEVLTLLSWNIQTFTAGKSLKSSYANQVINGILTALSVDLCSLLETREDSYVNMGGVDEGLKGSGGQAPLKKQKSDDDEEEIEDDDTDTPFFLIDESGSGNRDTSHEGKEKLEDDSPELTYQQIVSEMTGKRWLPPWRLYVHHKTKLDESARIVEYQSLEPTLKVIANEGSVKPELVLDCLINAAKSEKKSVPKFCAIASNLLTKQGAKFAVIKKKKGAKKDPIPGFMNLETKPKNELHQIAKRLIKDSLRFKGIGGKSPAEIKHAKDYRNSPKVLVKYCTDKKGSPIGDWRIALTHDSMEIFRSYFELAILDGNLKEVAQPDWNKVYTVPLSDSWRCVAKRRVCQDPNCAPLFEKRFNWEPDYLGMGNCKACRELGPYTTNMQNLRHGIDQIARYVGSHQESYSVLVRPSGTVFASEGAVWLRGKCVKVHNAASKLLMHAPLEQVIKANVVVNLLGGSLLEFQGGKSAFYGRCPFMVPLQLWMDNSNNALSMPVVMFHGPFGKAGVEPRVKAMEEMLKGGVGNPEKALGDFDYGLVMGDFNLNWTHGTNAPEVSAKALYEQFRLRGFLPMVEQGTASSLKSTTGDEWMKIAGKSSSEFTSSAYDNIFLKGNGMHGLGGAHLTSCVVDVIEWIENRLNQFPLLDDKPVGFDLLPPKTQAFYIYHHFVSDHLPVMCDIVVQSMPETSVDVQASRKHLDFIRWEMEQRKKSFEFLCELSFDEVIDFGLLPKEPFQHSYSVDHTSGEPVAVVRGVVLFHQDHILGVCCEPQPGHQMHVKLPLIVKDVPAAGDELQTLRLEYPVSSGIWLQVRNPRPRAFTV